MADYLNTISADSLTGTAGEDSFSIGSGSLGEGNDVFYGYGGNDQIFGGQDNDTLYGGLDNDVITGGDGADVLYGGEGFDQFRDVSGNDTIFGGNDSDILYFSSAVTMTITGGPMTVSSGGFQITFSGIERFSLADFANDVTGSAGNDDISGGAGNDTFRGMDGDDRIFLGSGNDLASGGNGNDYLLGLTTTGNKRVFGGAGNDTIFMGEGRDTAYGGSGDDTMLQGDESVGPDLFYGEDGDDFINSKGGADSLYGGAGNNTVSLLSYDGSFFNGVGALSIDLRLTTQTVMFNGVGVLVESFDNVALQAATTRATGNANANKFTSYSGDDLVIAMGGNDTMAFGMGSDRIYGGNGDDFFDQTENFSDTGLRGAIDTGADLLSGGAGADTFRFLNAVTSPYGATRRDTITDFTRGSDKIDLSLFYDVNLLVDADVTFTFIGNTAYSNQRGQLRFASGVLQGDVNGDGVTDFSVNLTGITSLSVADLIL